MEKGFVLLFIMLISLFVYILLFHVLNLALQALHLVAAARVLADELGEAGEQFGVAPPIIYKEGDEGDDDHQYDGGKGQCEDDCDVDVHFHADNVCASRMQKACFMLRRSQTSHELASAKVQEKQRPDGTLLENDRSNLENLPFRAAMIQMRKEMLPFATGAAEVAGRHAVLVAENAVERAAVVEARVEGNLLDGLVGLRQQLRGTCQTVAVDELQEGLSATTLADGVGMLSFSDFICLTSARASL